MSPPAVRCEALVKVYGSPGQETAALSGVDLTIAEGEMVALLGPSGSGKSTLLWLLAGLMRPTAGRAEVYGQRMGALSSRSSAEIRRRDIGVVLQTPARNLIPYDTAFGNVMFAQRQTRRRAAAKRQRTRSLLERVGLAPLGTRLAGGLSGGEQQRLAIAIALANHPGLLLADEPTSQLDGETAAAVLDLIKAAHVDDGMTVLAVTHDVAVGAALGRTLTIRDGRVGAEGRGGDEFVVVGRDGSIQLPEDLLEVLPPGSLATATRTENGVELRPVGPDGE